MLHLCRCKRNAGREEVEVQAECNISILYQRRHPRRRNIMRLTQCKWDFSNERLRPLTRQLEHQFSAPAQAMQVCHHCVSGELGELAFAGRAQDTEPDLGHEAKLRDLEMVKNVRRYAALATRLKEQGPTC